MKYNDSLGCSPGNRCPDYPNCMKYVERQAKAKMKLKTLKDLEIFNDIDGMIVHGPSLKEEAIKWVLIGDQIKTKADRCVNAWIIHFFNISEEDLK